MRTYVVVAATLTFIPVLAATQVDEKQKALDELKGSWEVVKSEPKGGLKRLVFAGDKITVVLDDGEQREGSFTVDPKAKPAQIDMIRGNEKMLGIYEVSGDTLRMGISIKGDQRPTEFKAGEDGVVIILKRAKAALPVTDAERKEAERLGGLWHLVSASAAGVTTPWMDLKDAEVTIKGQELTFKNFFQTATQSSFFRVGNAPPVRRPLLKTITTTEIAIDTKDSPPASVRLDVTTIPKRIDLQLQRVTLPGIYILENDQLKIGLALPGSDRPTELTPDPKRILLVLGRKKPDLEARQRANRREQERLQGAWTVESGSYDTAKLSDQDRKGFRLRFGGESLKWEEAGTEETLAVQLDPQAIPAAINLTVSGGPNKGRTIRGIYLLEKDQLVLRLPPSFSLDRPRDLRLPSISVDPPKDGKQAMSVDAVLSLKRDNP